MVEVTSRTIGGHFLLRSEPRLDSRIVGVLGRAQAYAGVEIYGVNCQSHYHLDLGVEDADQLAAFECLLSRTSPRRSTASMAGQTACGRGGTRRSW